MCLIYVSSVSAINSYFHHLRHLAIAVVASGAAVGGVIIPLLVQALLDYFGLSGALLINGGLTLNAVALGMTIFPICDSCDHSKNNEKLMAPDGKSSNVKIIEEEALILATENASESKSKCQLCRRKLVSLLRRARENMYQYTRDEMEVVANPDFIKFMLSILLSAIGISVFYVYNCEYSITMGGVTRQEAAVLVSIFGLSNVCGRVGAGVPLGRGVCGRGQASYTIFMFGLACLAIAIFCFLFTVSTDFFTFAAISAGLGSSYGVHTVLYTVASMDVMGPQHLPKVFGYASFSSGLACLVAPPLAGWMSESDMRVAFYASSFFCLIGFFMILWLCLTKWGNTKKQNKMNNIQGCYISSPEAAKLSEML